MLGEKKLSFMTLQALEKLRIVNEHKDIVFSPLTTRSLEQYQRINFFENKSAKLAFCANGGILLENGVVNKKWYDESMSIAGECIGEFNTGIRYLENDKNVYLDIRVVDGLFVFTKSSLPLITKAYLKEILDDKKVTVYNVGDKVYIFPNILNKGLAIKRIKKIYNFDTVICAGDSDFDVPMLREADVALCPEKLGDYILQCIKFDVSNNSFAEKILNYILENGRIL